MKAFRTFAHVSHNVQGCTFLRLYGEVRMQYSDTHAPQCGHLQDSLSSAPHQINTPPPPLPFPPSGIWRKF